MLRILIMSLLLALSACGPTTVALQMPENCRAEFTPSQLISGNWRQQPGIWRLRQAALLEIGPKKIPLEGFMRLDLQRQEARLLAMNETGMVLFDLQVTSGGEQLLHAVPQVKKIKALTRGVAQSLRQIFLAPQPQLSDQLANYGNSQRLQRKIPGGSLQFTYDCRGDLRETRKQTESSDWRVVYSQYQMYNAARLPEQLVLNDYRSNIKLSLWLKEVKTEP